MQQPKRILLIDDNVDDLLACNLLLQKKGYTVMTMTGCKKRDELLEILRTFKPELILVEEDMMGLDEIDIRIPITYFSAGQDVIRLAEAIL